MLLFDGRAFSALDDSSPMALPPRPFLPRRELDLLLPPSYDSSSPLLLPLHLQDYANPSRWGESGFARFIVAVCTLSSRRSSLPSSRSSLDADRSSLPLLGYLDTDVDDPRVRANPADPSSAGKAYLELFKKMQDLPSADRPTLYSMQASFLAVSLLSFSRSFEARAEQASSSLLSRLSTAWVSVL